MVDRAAFRGRNHDVSLWIPRDGGVVVIRKHSYPKWLFRLPSGAVHDGEAVEEGVKREAKEETGLDVEVEAYLLRASVTLTYRRTWRPESPPPPPGAFSPLPAGAHRQPPEEVRVPWVSHVFRVRATDGPLDPVDKREIADIRVAGLEEFRTTLRDNLVKVGGGFKFRGWITDALAESGLLAPRPPTRTP
jgi:8-oxo-dGTP pyrophosphatase MutT (NUDIX family)